MIKIGQRSTRVPPVFQEPNKVEEVRREIEKREFEDRHGKFNKRTMQYERDPAMVRTEAMYPRRVTPGQFSTAARDTNDIFQGPKAIRGRRVDQGSIERGGGRVVRSGHTHAARSSKGTIKKLN